MSARQLSTSHESGARCVICTYNYTSIHLVVHVCCFVMMWIGMSSPRVSFGILQVVCRLEECPPLHTNIASYTTASRDGIQQHGNHQHHVVHGAVSASAISSPPPLNYTAHLTSQEMF